MVKKRNSNIELLRIISIIMIVLSHYCVHGAGRKMISNMPLGVNRFLLEFFTLGNLGTILFVLITGYYLINSKEIKFKKIFRLIFQILFYSIVIYIILIILGIEDFSAKSFIKNFLPITFKGYWFATTYIVLYLFHPFINKLLNNITRKEHFTLISMMFIIFSLLSTFTTSDYYGNELIQFFLFYSIGAYLFKYPSNILGKNKNNFKIMLISIILIILSIICFDILGTYKSIFWKYSIYLLNRTSPLAILFCIALFDIFSRKKIYENKIINLISPLIFGVYLISDNDLLRPIIWHSIFRNSNYIKSSYLIFHMIIAVALTIIVCLGIEFIRKEFFEKNIFKLVDKKIDRIEEKYKKMINDKMKFD